jgi:hypothetical protein
MTETSDQVIFWLVVGSRLFLPMLIPRWPLPGILLSLVIDWIDGSIFRSFTNLPIEGYQAYDKALDIYYLAIAYLATLRNWSYLFAFKLGRFLFYFRLVGVLLFELTGTRALLLIFTNAFEYFFIFYEAVRVRWDPLRLSKRALVIALVLIVVFVKIPQEYIVHIAQINTTDWIKSNIFGVSTELSWGQALAASPGVTLAIAIILLLIVIGLWWTITRKLPPADWKPRFAADPLPPVDEESVAPTALSRRFLNNALLEKAVLVSLLVVIFAQILPGAQAPVIQLAVGATVIVMLNALASRWLAKGGITFRSLLIEFVVMAGVGYGAVLLLNFVILPVTDGGRDLEITLFLVLLLTLIVTYYDDFRPAFDHRFAKV